MNDAPRTPKAEQTRARIAEAAFRLFREQGYEKTTLRGIAKSAGVSVGLAYRYFDGKEALVQELYAQLSDAFAERVAALPPGPWTVRALAALDASFTVLEPHRETLAALLGPMTRAGPIYAPLAAGEEKVRQGFVRAVTGASDAPTDGAWIGRALYLGQLAILLFWFLDRSEGQVATARLRAWGAGALPTLALFLPGFGGMLAPLVDIVELGILGRSP